MEARRSSSRIETLEAKVADLERRLGEAFTIEEMDVLREQLAERAQLAEAAQEALEWQLRTELQSVRETEAMFQAAVARMRQVSNALAGLLDDSSSFNNDEPTSLRAVNVSRRVHA